MVGGLLFSLSRFSHSQPLARDTLPIPRHYDIAHSLQLVLEETVLELAIWLQQVTNADALCLAGGVALNCVLNAWLRDRGPFNDIWVQPAAGDAGTALGAALWIDAQERSSTSRSFCMEHAFLGPAYSDDEIEQFLSWSKLLYRRLTHLVDEVADMLVQDKIIGWFQHRMEFGPRALGARSILTSPLHACMQARLNEIKDREDFRPVAPVVLEEEAAHWFANANKSPFMLFVYDVLPEKADRIPAMRHVDGTARIQTINRQQHSLYYDLIKAFQVRTGVPVLVNTSFNTRGEPIVCTPRDAAWGRSSAHRILLWRSAQGSAGVGHRPAPAAYAYASSPSGHPRPEALRLALERSVLQLPGIRDALLYGLNARSHQFWQSTRAESRGAVEQRTLPGVSRSTVV